MAQIHLDRPVGTSSEYSNLNYLLLGQLVEQVSGQTYEAYIQQHIFLPLEMKHSYLDIKLAQQAGLAKGNRILFGFLSSLELPYPRWLIATGYHFSTAEDMAHLLIAHLNQGRYGNISLLSPESSHLQEISNRSIYYDIHWIGQADMPRYYTDAQSGTTLDYAACYYILPTFRTGVIVLSNANTAEATPTKNACTIAFDILEMTNGFTLRSNAPSIKAVYAGIDLGLFAIALLPITQILRLRAWRKGLMARSEKPWRSFLLILLINIVLPVIFLVGIPALVSTAFVPGLSYWRGWSFALYILPDIGYSLLAITSLLIAAGFIKLFWYFQAQREKGV
jgi:CubicO group peptidase (beta-lactamase class C family)